MFRFLLAIIILVSGCSNVSNLNLESHSFGGKPSEIIWLQIGGLKFEHLALLRLANKSADYKSSFERSSCIGQMWNYSLYDLRPDSEKSQLIQITGQSNINGTCSDYENNRPLWGYLKETGYLSYILESGFTSKNSLVGGNCSEKKNEFRDESVLFSMREKLTSTDKTYHYQEKGSFNKSEVYYDTSCRGKECYSSLSSNVVGLYERIKKNSTHFSFVIKDDTYRKALKEKDIKKTEIILLEIEKIYNYFESLAKEKKNILLLLTSSAPLNLEFPLKGKGWKNLEADYKYNILRNDSLIGPVFATGARAENFCGIYRAEDVLERVLLSKDFGGLNFKLFNPFSK